MAKTVKALQHQPIDLEELEERIFTNEFVDNEEEMNELKLKRKKFIINRMVLNGAKQIF